MVLGQSSKVGQSCSCVVRNSRDADHNIPIYDFKEQGVAEVNVSLQ